MFGRRINRVVPKSVAHRPPRSLRGPRGSAARVTCRRSILVPPAKGDAALSPPDDALLKELETPSRMEDGDWLENAVSVPASENGDDLELVIEPSLGSQPDHNEVTQNLPA